MSDYFSDTTERGPIAIPAYSCLLSSNTRPCPDTCNNVKSLIEEHERQLTAIQEQVERLRKCLADAERRQVHAKQTLIRLHATLAPIKRLPPEIISEIFEWCSFDAASSPFPFMMSARSQEAPLLLGRVCRSWRAIAHTTPRIWRDIFLNVCDGRYSDGIRKDALPVLHTWLAHSGSLPLNLTIVCKTERVLPGLVDLFEGIAAHAPRWQTVQIRLQNAPVIYKLVCRTFSKCTSLLAFDVSDSGQCTSFFGNRQPEEGEDVEPLQIDLSLAPLRQLSLSLAGLTARDVQAPWATLTSLIFMQDARSSTTSITDYAAILRQCTSLRECTITIDSSVRDASLEPFTVPNLECLEFRVLREASRTTQMGDLLGVLDAPRLCALAIEDYSPRRDPILYHSQLKAFLRTHAQTLRHFKYSTTSKPFTADDLVALIVETPQLVELEYHPDEDSSPRALLDALTPRLQGNAVECLLPCLERLFVYWDTTETVCKVADMIEQRYALMDRGIARLHHLSCKPVRISFMYDCMPPHTLVENLAARLEPLCQLGLQVDWKAYRYDMEFWYC